MKILLAVVAVVLVVCLVIPAIAYFSYSNAEISLRKTVEAQQKSCEAVFDQTWKIIQQQAGVAADYRDSFATVYKDIMSERYNNARGGALMSWIKEANPTFDISLYKQLMVSIEAQRQAFTREQRVLIDLQREHSTMLQTFPGSLFLASRKPIDIVVVTSAKTEAVFQTGQENDITVMK